MKRALLFLSIICAVLSAHCKAEAFTCTDNADVYIDQEEPSTNYNDKTRLLISYHPTKGIARALLRFDIPGSITAPLIQSAILHLSSSGHTGGGTAITVDIHALNSGFVESTETWNTHSGGDYDASVFSSGSIPVGNDWLTTVDITTLVGERLNKVRDYGILMKLATEGPDKLYQNIASRECDNSSNPDYVEADEPPRLEITLYDDVLHGTVSGDVQSGVAIHLYRSVCGSWSLQQTIYTGTGGGYLFNGLANGTYRVVPEYAGATFQPTQYNNIAIPHSAPASYNFVATLGSR